MVRSLEMNLLPRPLAGSSSYYPEPFDKPHNGTKKPDYKLTPCTHSFLKGKCESGHEFLKALSCSREWCPDCGEFESMIHNRRVARWFPRVMQMRKLGYLVVTVPRELRKEFLNKKVLSEFRTYCKRKLQRMGYDRGLARYHWAGDCKHCRGGKIPDCGICQGTGADREFKPHLNFLIEEGYLSPAQFENKIKLFREDLGKWFNKKFREELNGVTVSGQCFYSYAETDQHRIHKLKYVTRATFRFYNKKVCDTIKGFRTSSIWGKWEKNKQERTSALVSFESGLCPCCGFNIKWKKDFVFRKSFEKMSKIHIEGGYFLINAPP